MGDTTALVREQVLAGRPITHGVARGIAHVDIPLATLLAEAATASTDPHEEISRLDRAIVLVEQHLAEHIREFHAPQDPDLAQVLAAQRLILNDQHFFASIRARVQDQQQRAERAVEEAFCAAADRLAATRDIYLRARAEDLRDVCQAIVRALVRGENAFRPMAVPGRDVVFVTQQLHVSSVLRALRAGAKAYVTTSDAIASHGAILLRAAGIPSVGNLKLTDQELHDGTELLVDATRGEVVVAPGPASLRRLARRSIDADAQRANRALPPDPAITADGRRITLWANIDTPDHASSCLDHHLHGLGLLRTEFFVLTSGRTPDEEEQRRAYQAVVDALPGRPVVIRTFDLGAEKVVAGLVDDTTLNPALALRGLRRHLWRFPGELRTQLRAILRASVNADLTILLPMVTHVSDVQMAKQHLQAVRQELDAAGIPYNQSFKLGAMIEVPAAVLAVADILAEVDSVCVGTNDLTQYLSAADRNNADVAMYLRPDVSGLVTAMEWIITRARKLGRVDDVSVGGELPSDPTFAARLAELGFTQLIVTPMVADDIRAAIAQVTVAPPRKATSR